MTLSPEQAAFVEAYPFALSSYITEDMQDRIAERIKATVHAEGHRRAMPAPKPPPIGAQLPQTASVAACVLGIVKQRPAWTFAELRAETGLHHNKLQYALDVCIIAGDVVRIEAKGKRHTYAMVTL